jgi:hypothetical protein
MRSIKNSIRAGVYAPVSDNVWGKLYYGARGIVNEDAWRYVHTSTNHMTNSNNIYQNIKRFAEKEL